MTSIENIIRSEVNPFDPTTFKPGNFWGETQNAAQTVNSIHQKDIEKIETILTEVTKDHHSRTILLNGESGSGKSYLLGRLKRTLNSKAFFAYIGPWPDRDSIRRHILRYTVDSLMQVPEGQTDSQLILWLKSLSAFTQRSLKQRLFDDSIWQLLSSNRQNFIKHLKNTYKYAGIYNSDNFFGALYELINSDEEHSALAYEWLRGNDLSEESLAELKIKKSIDTEDAAWETLANLGRISTETQPIVLCFDNLDNIPIGNDGFPDLQSLFNINTIIHNDSLKNFLIIISLITNYSKQNDNRIQQADKARIDYKIHLRNINLDQVEALWASRLYPIHAQTNKKPTSKISPLTREALEKQFPGGKTDPRSALIFARQEYQKYKDTLAIDTRSTDNITPASVANEAEFNLLWQDEYKKIQSKISRISLLATPELIKMLEETLSALEIQHIKPKLLNGKYANYSFSYQHPEQPIKIGIVWTEDLNMKSFYDVMNACNKALGENKCQKLYLIRSVTVGDSNLAGNQIYRQIFQGNSQRRHIKPTLSSVHYLATYHDLVNSALANELVVSGKTISLKELETLIRNTKIFDKCNLLQELAIVTKTETEEAAIEIDIKDFLLNLVKTQGYMGKNILIKVALGNFPQLNQSQVENQVQQLIWNNKIEIVNRKAAPKDQLVRYMHKL